MGVASQTLEVIEERARRGPLILITKRLFAGLISILSVFTVSHLVSPQQFGLAAMSATVFSFGEMLRDFGISSALMRKGSISPEEVSFLFWFNCAVTLALSLCIALAAPYIGSYYSQPIVCITIMASLAGFLVGGFSQQHRAILERDLRLKELAIVDGVGLLAGFLTTLILASVRHDVWAIVFGGLAQTLFSSLLVVALSRWIPGGPRRISGIRGILAFGANTSTFSISVFLANALPPVLIGSHMGPGELGSFTRATALLALPAVNFISPFAHAAMPLLTRLRPHPQRYREEYLALVRRLSMVLLPTAMILTFAAPSLIDAVLGVRWHTAGVLLAILSPTIAGFGHSYCVADIFITQDRSKEMRNLGIAELVFRSVVIVLALKSGLRAVVISMSCATACVQLFRMIIAGRIGPISFSNQVGASVPAILPSLASGAGCGVAMTMVDAYQMSPLVSAVLICCSGAVAAVAAAMTVKSSRTAMKDVASAFNLSRLSRLRG